jgi:hypothetical protein
LQEQEQSKMTQAFNLALHANFIDASGKVSASGIQPGAIPAAFPSGTIMLFVQTSAPTGWVKSTAHDNKALRVVSGTAGSGGSVGFTSAFESGQVGATTLTTAQIPAHTHRTFRSTGTGDPPFVLSSAGTLSNSRVIGNDPPIENTGGGGSHSHTINLAVQYVDVIICTKS